MIHGWDVATHIFYHWPSIIGPAELYEHSPYHSKDGAWLQRKVVETVATGVDHNITALVINNDETDGLGDHVVPFH